MIGKIARLEFSYRMKMGGRNCEQSSVELGWPPASFVKE